MQEGNVIEPDQVYTRGQYFGDPVWILEDYGHGLYLAVFDYGRGKRSPDYRIYTTTFRVTTEFIALDYEDQLKFKVQATLAVVREIQRRCSNKKIKKEAAALWSE